MPALRFDSAQLGDNTVIFSPRGFQSATLLRTFITESILSKIEPFFLDSGPVSHRSLPLSSKIRETAAHSDLGRLSISQPAPVQFPKVPSWALDFSMSQSANEFPVLNLQSPYHTSRTLGTIFEIRPRVEPRYRRTTKERPTVHLW